VKINLNEVWDSTKRTYMRTKKPSSLTATEIEKKKYMYLIVIDVSRIRIEK